MKMKSMIEKEKIRKTSYINKEETFPIYLGLFRPRGRRRHFIINDNNEINPPLWPRRGAKRGTARMVRDLETFFPARCPVPCSLGKSMGMKEEGQRSGEITFE